MDPHPHHAHAETDESALVELLDLDAEVLHEYLSEVTAWIHESGHHRRPSPRRILDLGSGTGSGTFALLQRFPAADVAAFDVSGPMLRRLRQRAGELGVGDRIRTMQADLNVAWPHIEPVDLVWASASLHHMADPDQVLGKVFGATRKGGLLVVLEMDSFPRFLPADLGIGAPGLEERAHAVLAEQRAEDVPLLGADWGPRLGKAGFTVEAERPFAIDLKAPLPESAGRYALASLRRARPGLDGKLSAEDLATLDTLLDSDGPEGILRRDDLTVRATRTVWMARRP
jgi:SAM-dependent methyltransferase